jgi:hypothetical protein
VSDDLLSLRKMQVLSWVCLLVLCAGSWVIMSWEFAWAVAVGGVISIVSFMLSHKDVAGFMASLNASEEGQGEKKALKIGKSQYIIKFWLRLAVIGLILLILIKSGKVNIFGLLVGLSTVVFSITLTTVSAARHYIISSRR